MSASVAALKNVDFPQDGFPTNPSNIMSLGEFESPTSGFLRLKKI